MNQYHDPEVFVNLFGISDFIPNFFTTRLDQGRENLLFRRMKNSFGFLLFLLFVHPSFAQKIVNMEFSAELEKVINSAVTRFEQRETEDGSTLLFQYGKKIPFTGWCKQVSQTGKLRSLKEYMNGKLHRLYIYWWKRNAQSCHCIKKIRLSNIR